MFHYKNLVFAAPGQLELLPLGGGVVERRQQLHQEQPGQRGVHVCHTLLSQMGRVMKFRWI